MKINPEQSYSGLEAQKYVGIKSRQYIGKYISEGHLRAIVVKGDGDRGKRYIIKGEWLEDFKKRYDKGLVKGEKYTIEFVRSMLKETLDYCNENGIKTLKELINHADKINK